MSYLISLKKYVLFTIENQRSTLFYILIKTMVQTDIEVQTIHFSQVKTIAGLTKNKFEVSYKYMCVSVEYLISIR